MRNSERRPAIDPLERREMLSADISLFDVLPSHTTADPPQNVVDLIQSPQFNLEGDSAPDGVKLLTNGLNSLNRYEFEKWGIPGMLPNLHGQWFIGSDSRPRVEQNGLQLVLTNEHGHRVAGKFIATDKIQVAAWGNLVGALSAGQIRWSNGSVWNKTPNLAGDWFFGAVLSTSAPNGGPHIEQSGITLRLTNENGDQSRATLTSPYRIVAHDWGGLGGSIRKGWIQWDNGTIWSQPLPQLSREWAIGSDHRPRITKHDGRELTFVNERGEKSAGRFVEPHRVVASGWGNLHGTVDDGRIYWDNGTIWDQFDESRPSAIWPTWIVYETIVGVTGNVLGSRFVGFVNERGEPSWGWKQSESTVYAANWSLAGAIAPGAIYWGNGTVWLNNQKGYVWGPDGVERGSAFPDGGQFDIDFQRSGMSLSLQQTVQRAVDRWEQVIVGDVADAWMVDGSGRLISVDDLYLTVQVGPLDGAAGGTLASASVQQTRPESNLPIWSHITIDERDVSNPQLETILLHEIGHALGFGAIWNALGLLNVSSPGDPRFVGAAASSVFRVMTQGSQSSVPVENQGTPGDGSYGGHWREKVFGNELMTSGINAGQSIPLSPLTVAAMQDIGYQVNLEAADDYTLPQTNAAFSGFLADTAPTGAYAALWLGETTDEDTAKVITISEATLTPDVLGVQRFGALVTDQTQGSVEYNGAGVFTYHPNGRFSRLAEGETATDTFSYTLVQPDGTTETIAVVVAIIGQNDARDVFDVDNDGFLSPSDALAIINKLVMDGPVTLSPAESADSGFYYDVDGDGVLSPSDALQVINRLLNPPVIQSGEGEAAVLQVAAAPSLKNTYLAASSFGALAGGARYAPYSAAADDAAKNAQNWPTQRQAAEPPARVPIDGVLRKQQTLDGWPEPRDEEIESLLLEIAGDVARSWTDPALS